MLFQLVEFQMCLLISSQTYLRKWIGFMFIVMHFKGLAKRESRRLINIANKGSLGRILATAQLKLKCFFLYLHLEQDRNESGGSKIKTVFPQGIKPQTGPLL